MKVVAIVPIKLNNERLAGKNLMFLGNKPLIHYCLETLSDIREINERYVYCSNESISDYLIGGVDFLRRPEFLDSPTTNFTQIFRGFQKQVEADVYVYAHATAPFVTVETVSKAVSAVLSGSYDSAFCAEKIQDFLWRNGEPLNFDATNIPRSQDLPVIYRETSGVYVFHKTVFEKYQRRVGKNPLILEVSFKEATDINTAEDFKRAEALLSY